MKKLAVFFAVLLCFSVNSFAYNTGVYDDADLFTDAEELSIIEEAEIFSQEKDFSLAVVTTDFTSGLPSEEYADDFLDNLIDTEGWQENSFLILIDMDNRNVWISTTGDCQLAFSDSEIESVIDGGYSELSGGYYFDAVLGMIRTATATDTVIDENNDFYITDDEWYFGEEEFEDNIIQFDGDYYQTDSDGNWEIIDDYEYNGGYSSDNRFEFTDFLFYLAVGLAVGAIAVFFVKGRYKNQGKGDEFGSEDIILNLTSSNDTIISRNVVTTKIPRNNNNNHHRGGGSFGGGSSVHRSSGGRSHGGGGRGF